MAESPNDLRKPRVRLVTRTDEAPVPEPPPPPLTSLVGRERAETTVRDLLSKPAVRLVTLTGTGGIGKTRLAIQVANLVAEDFPNGVAFVSLAPLSDPDLVLPTIANALGISGPGIDSLDTRLIRLLDGQHMLLVLDNFEQVSGAASALAGLLQATRTVKALITSRTPLRLSGEHEFAVAPLALPERRDTVDAIADSPACALFEARMQAVRPDFAIDDANAATIVEICRRLGGVPLAIELAAARGKVLTPVALLEQLSRDPDLLSGGPGDLPARHQTMRAAIQWSYDLLSPAQQTLVQQLSVFAGGCSIDAADTVANPARMSTLFDGLTGLIDTGLVRHEPHSNGQPRYWMLDPIRRFALDRLVAGDVYEATIVRFAKWCSAIARQAAAAFAGDGPGIWADVLAGEIDNFRSAIVLLTETGDRVAVLQLATELSPLWSAMGHQREGLHLLQQTIAQIDELEYPAEVMQARLVASRLATMVDDFPLATELALRARSSAERLHDQTAFADAETALGNLARGTGDLDAAGAHYQTALDRYRALDDRYNTGYILVQLGKLGDLGTPDNAGNPTDLATAVQRSLEGLAIYRQLHNRWGIARATNQLSYLYYKSGRFLEAAQEAYEALWLYHESGNFSEGSQCVENLADIAGATGQPLLAARLYGIAEALQDRYGTPMWPFYRAEYEQEVDRVRALLTPAELQAAWNAGRAVTEDALLDEARAAADLLSAAPDRSPTAPSQLPANLTNREIDVLKLLATGATNPEIADALFISVTTVKTHVQSLMRKLDLSSRSALAVWATRNGIVPPS